MPSDEAYPNDYEPESRLPRSNGKMPWTWKEYPWSIDLPIALAPKPTNPGSRDHPNCRPCAFVFRLAGDYVRLRCANAETCEFCHDPSHPRYRGRHSRRKSRRMRTDRQLHYTDQEEEDDEVDSYDENNSANSASHTMNSSTGKDDQVQRQDGLTLLREADNVNYLKALDVNLANDDCKLLYDWALEFGSFGENPGNKYTRDGDSKAPSTSTTASSSKGYSSSTTLCSFLSTP